MINILETGARKNFIRATLVLPILMGLVPEKNRPKLIELRTRFLRQKEYKKLDVEENMLKSKIDRIQLLKNQATSLFKKNERKGVFMMEKALNEESRLFDRKGSIERQRFVMKNPITVKKPVFPPEPYHGPGDNLSFLDIQFMKKYYKAKMEIALKLSLKDVVQECSDILKALETAVEGGSLNYPSKGK
jgi:hypothetical protein